MYWKTQIKGYGIQTKLQNYIFLTKSFTILHQDDTNRT